MNSNGTSNATPHPGTCRPGWARALAVLTIAGFAVGTFGAAGLAKVAQNSADGIVYGSTPGGFCAAIAAAREGASVILLEPTDHVGGLSTGGLSHCDSKQMRRETLLGLFDEWHRRIVKDYVDRGLEAFYEPPPHPEPGSGTGILPVRWRRQTRAGLTPNGRLTRQAGRLSHYGVGAAVRRFKARTVGWENSHPALSPGGGEGGVPPREGAVGQVHGPDARPFLEVEAPYDPARKDTARWTFEPQVALRVTRQMLKEAGVTVLTGRYLQSVTRDGPQIRSLVTQSGTFTAKAFEGAWMAIGQGAGVAAALAAKQAVAVQQLPYPLLRQRLLAQPGCFTPRTKCRPSGASVGDRRWMFYRDKPVANRRSGPRSAKYPGQGQVLALPAVADAHKSTHRNPEITHAP